mgnify:CR=1 FL=1
MDYQYDIAVIGAGPGGYETAIKAAQILPKKPLHAYGMTREDIDEFAHSVITSQGRLMANNFVPLDEERVRKIYRELY